jgi:hypothetical protein
MICQNINLKLNQMVIHNEIFDTFRGKQEEIKNAIKLLEANGFIIYNKEKVYVEK